MLNTQEKYVFGRGQKETERLDAQHILLAKVTGNTLIHPSIPKEGILSVADVGTGTGIWLRDIAQVLDNTESKIYYHGFDISAEQFPIAPSRNTRFTVQDITLPFPEEHWNRYGLVHVRLLVAALDETEYKKAVWNLAAILRPGGYLQWEEIDEESYSSIDNPVIDELYRCFSHSLEAEGKCFAASAKVVSECQEAGLFQEVQRVAYRSDTNPEVDLRAEVQARLATIIKTLYASLLIRSGQVEDENAANERAVRLIEQLAGLCKEGKSPPQKIMWVVARKA
ncbi:LaeA-like methyltransferase [Aspergillus keveii]|uniref:LaeA-like methyltransferase n=1 Tax=Aspergillus keveii TaxID=714993 RepID=A0ABR4FJC5_9EURO